ncbi:hypothetical protein [Ureibacillus sinduriensis]|uniref:Uncharacterized protein n=1 Tax=Ureibacillus sinduriensis BLB-1 = JCM 15800 TaxID=1384057 RepID=A0A0A3I5K7_9BACL|nr:hypothetical protein [Ureibacillus sinduriensis]KGR78765.1 hypothetical protein CD33_00850 [Ureibacillus sinduriensis BLB-1 = JCM 15800]
MKKFILIVVFSFILAGIFTFINQPQAETVNRPSDKETSNLFESLQNELYEIYDIGAFKTASNPNYTINEIIIPINGSQEYYDSVKDEVESLVKNIIKTTSFKNYSVIVEKNKLDQFFNEKAKDEMDLRYEITKTVHDSLYEAYQNQIGDIGITDSAQQLIIEVNTFFNGQESNDFFKEMENKLNIIFQEKLSSNLLVKESSITIHIYNKYGERIN